MQYTINELKHKIFKDVYDVYEIFQNFFDEEHTDLQNIPDDEDIVMGIALGYEDKNNILSQIKTERMSLDEACNFYK